MSNVNLRGHRPAHVLMTAQELLEIGLAYERLGKIEEAQRSYARSVALHPQDLNAYHRLAVLALQSNDAVQALTWIDKALTYEQTAVGLWNNRALALVELARYDEADHAFHKAVELSPQNWTAYYNQGRMLLKQKRYEEAEPVLRRAVELDPNSTITLNNLGLVLNGLWRYDEAIAMFDRALALDPANAELMENKAVSLYCKHDLAGAEALLRRVLSLYPNEPNAHYNLSSVLLSGGNIVDGFREYEWRWQSRDWKPIRQYWGRPLWKGHKLAGETLLVWHEQGLGDTIQFIRFIRELAKHDCEIIVEVQQELHRLLAASLNIANVRWLRPGAKPPTFDLHVPMMSLPHLLDFRFETASIFRPYLVPRSRDLEDWRGKLKSMTAPENRKKKRIGLVWKGSPGHPHDHNRSMTWETIRPLVEKHKDRFQFFSLQKTEKADHPDVIELGDAMTDFGVTASMVAFLDLVIAVDTSIIHLTGAIGKRAWVMLAHTPDWRWTLGEDRTKWYPTVSLYWQKQPGKWDDVIQEVSEMLAYEK
jgi:tetratricopeptide (TPR) repeat protein